MEGLNGKVIVFAGAGGIANSTAEFLGKVGAKVVVGDILQASADSCAKAAQNAGGHGVAMVLDIANEQNVKNLIDLAIQTYGRIDGLFNVAANIHPDEVAKDTNPIDIDLASWQRNIDVNLTGYLLTLKYSLPHMIAVGGGSVVNTISDAVYAGMADKIAYSVTKAGIGAMTRNVARRYGKQGIRANALSPGLVMTENTRKNTPPGMEEMVIAMMPAQRLGKPEDIGAMAAFLFSDLAEWITGQSLCVDGGAIMRT